MKINDNISEQERKELNKKLLKKTFISEIKSTGTEKNLKIIIYFISLFIALLISDLIIESLHIDFVIFDIFITAVIIMVLLFVGEILIEKSKK